MKGVSINIFDEKWQTPVDDDEPDGVKMPTGEAFSIALNDINTFIKPDPWFLTGGYKNSETTVDSQPVDMGNAPDVLELGDALGLIGVGMTSPVSELESSVYDCLYSEINKIDFTYGHNYVASSWMQTTCKKLSKATKPENFEELSGIFEYAEYEFFQKLRTRELHIYGMPNTTLNYQVIPQELLMYPLKVNYLKKSIYLNLNCDSFSGGFAQLNHDALLKIQDQIHNGEIPAEWIEIKCLKSEIQRLWPNPLRFASASQKEIVLRSLQQKHRPSEDDLREVAREVYSDGKHPNIVQAEKSIRSKLQEKGFSPAQHINGANAIRQILEENEFATKRRPIGSPIKKT